MGKHKDEHGKTRVGVLLQGLATAGKKIGPEVLKIAGNLTGREALTNLGKALDNDPAVDENTKALIMEQAKIDLENTKSAREMQIAALNQDDVFSKRFVYYLALFWSVIGASYMFFATFCEVKNTHIVDTVLGFLLGTIVATVINYFFGSSNAGEKLQNMFKRSD